MEEFIRQSNIRLFRKQLAECTDTETRRVIERLLADQELRPRLLMTTDSQRPPEVPF